MKKIWIVFIISIVISSSVLAFSIKDFLSNFNFNMLPQKDKLTGLTYHQVSQVSQVCTENALRCNTGSECSGSPCVMKCQNNAWVEYSYCQESCSSGQCTTSTSPTTLTVPVTNGGTPNQEQCQDGTLSNQCSVTKPYFCSNGNLIENCNACGCPTGKECSNNACIIKVGEPYDPGGKEEKKEGNENLLNIPPIISPIGPKTLKVSQEIEFKVNAIDSNKDPLTFSFENNEKRILTSLLECSMLENAVRCKGLKEGEEIIKIIVSDSVNKAEESIEINVLRELPYSNAKIIAGSSNTAPVADAGSDITGIPGQKIILDASKSYDKEGLLSIQETYKWYQNNELIGSGKNIEKTFSIGNYNIKLVVKDSENVISEDEINVIIKEKLSCKNTKTTYYPEDTICNNKWPIKEGSEFKINSLTEGSCSLFEVCSEDLDPIIEDSIKCCTEKELSDSNKISSCNFAIENSNTLKNCQAVYLIKSLGREAVYMEGYLDAEMCCKGVESLCPKESYLYSAQPLPENLKNKGLKCSNNPENNPNGIWKSDTNLALNEIALSDVPAHASLNILKSGTCVDYSVSATTLLRKVGFSKDDVITIEASNHAYNLIRFNLDKKYTLFDMTGNNEGLKLGKVPQGYDYCQNIINCYNDNGKIDCPSNKEIIGCENVKENIGRSTGVIGGKIKNIILELFEKIKAEVLR